METKPGLRLSMSGFAHMALSGTSARSLPPDPLYLFARADDAANWPPQSARS
jgi:hypothetical protein